MCGFTGGGVGGMGIKPVKCRGYNKSGDGCVTYSVKPARG